jgi:hypothetical protein
VLGNGFGAVASQVVVSLVDERQAAGAAAHGGGADQQIEDAITLLQER